ncbi:immunoglobulin superfamily member 3-like [Cetorhinus maximus]
MRKAAVTDTDVHWYRELPGKDMERVLTHDIRNITRRSPGFTGRFQPSRDTSNNSFILTITNVQPSDTAVYYCKVWGDISGNGTRLNITNPLADPVLLQYPNVSKVPEGVTVELQCAMYNASVNDTDVHWHHQRPGYNSEWALSQFVNGTITKSRGFHDRFQLSKNVSSNSYILTIVNVTLKDTAVYNCSVWSYIYGAGTQLNVTDANAPVLIQSPSLERVTEGHTAQLQCTMGNVAVTDTDVHWYRELPGKDMEQVLTHDIRNITRRSPGFTGRFQPSRDTSNNSFILTITNVQPSDTAVYYCKVWGDISGNGTRLNITNPLADPVLLQYPNVTKVPEGVTVELQCAMYNASVNDTDVHWHHQRPGYNSEWALSQFVNGTITKSRGFHDRFQLSRNVSSNSYILTIVNVTLKDTAVYNCSVWSYIYGAGTQLNVTDANAPVLIQSPSLERVTEGHTAQLQCTMGNVAVTDTDVHWYRELPGKDMEQVLTHDIRNISRRNPGFTGRFQPSRDTSNNSFILTITNVQPSDTAVYYCKVWGDISGNGTRLNVPILKFSYFLVAGLEADPVLIQHPEIVKVPEGGTVEFRCDLRYQNESDTVKKFDVHWFNQTTGNVILSYETNNNIIWVQQHHNLEPSRDVANNSYILTIRDVQFRDSTVYICGIWGRIYGNGSRLNVTSANAPVLIQSPSLERVTEGHTAQLQCTMRKAAVTDTDVHWYRELPGKDMERVLTHDIRNITRRSPGFTGRFQPSRDTSNNSFILTITNVQPSDTAAYYCKVWGDISGNGTRLNITSPLADPVLLQYPNLSKVPEGETVELQCAMYNASVNDTDVHWHHQRPGYNSEWAFSQFVNGTITKSRGFHDRFQLSRNVSSNSYILTIVNVTLNDTAVYNCSVWSYIYGAGTQLNVTDANAPVLIQSLSLERVTEGHTAQLQCTMGNAAVTDTDVHWYRELPGKDMEWVLTHDKRNITRRSPGFTERFQSSRDTSINSFILTITNVQPSDTAAYYCKVWGDISGNGTRLNVPVRKYTLLLDKNIWRR